MDRIVPHLDLKREKDGHTKSREPWVEDKCTPVQETSCVRHSVTQHDTTRQDRDATRHQATGHDMT